MVITQLCFSIRSSKTISSSASSMRVRRASPNFSLISSISFLMISLTLFISARIALYSVIAASSCASLSSIFLRSKPDRRPNVMETIACACSSERLGFSSAAKASRFSAPADPSSVAVPSNRFIRLIFAVGWSGEERMILITSSMLSIASL